MAWVAYRDATGEHMGLVDGTDYIPLKGVQRLSADTGADTLVAAEPDSSRRIAASQVELLPPSSNPSKVFCVGLNYKEHVTETKRDLPTYPVLFPKFASNLIAANRPIRVPPESAQVDYEGELAVVIGTRGRRISREHALEHVLGYTVANDVTMRDYQYKTHQWLQGKAWDASTPVGPHIVPAEEVDLPSCGIRTVVNGEVVQESDLSHLIFDVPTLVATISEFTELVPGDLILTGTPGGVGFRRDPQLFLRPGDEVSVEIDHIGRIHNTVEAE
jgi:acylpyruvate hydrolase